MSWVSTETTRGLRSSILLFGALTAVFAFGTSAADARHHHRSHVHIAGQSRHSHHSAAGGTYSPPTASIVVDGNTGAVLQEANPDALRHPASLSKVMTLYLLFERLDAGKIRLDTPLTVSEHASIQAPTKLGLKPGQTISVEDAIRAVVTRSANDAAVVIAENLGGSEEAFARLMTQKARALGMSRTTYVNASGLPDDEQITTARDQALLGRAIQDRFPRYYRFFSTTSFVFRGTTIRGHNHLLGSVPGVDGIKTGFTEASGFNLLTSVHRDGHYIVGVVLGGRSAGERDAHMRALINANIMLAAVRRGAPAIAEHTPPAAHQPHEPSGKLAQEFAQEAQAIRARPAIPAAAGPHAVVGSNEPIRPVIVRTIHYHTVTARSAPMKPMPAMVPAAQPAQPTAAEAPADSQVSSSPGQMLASAGPMPAVTPAPAVESAAAEAEKSSAVNPPPQPAHVHSGWVIQIGAFGGESEARQHLSAAQLKLRGVLAAADPFTEPVQKGDTTLYRARFAGFDKATAEAACRQLKRSDVPCITLKD